MAISSARITAKELLVHLRSSSKHCPQPPRNWMNDELPKLEAQWGACGSFLGMKRIGRRWRAQPALVVLTTQKRNISRHAGEVSKVPSSISWKDGRVTHRLSTDVVEVGNSVVLQAVFGPADEAASVASGTIGAVVTSPQGRFLTTAGHVFASGSGATVRVISGASQLPATLAERVVDGTIDYALLKPVNPASCDNLFRDLIRIGPVYTPTLADRGRRVFVLHDSGTATPAKCIGVNGRFNLNGVQYFDVIQTTPVTEDGFSGGALVDEAMRLWGFVLGVVGGRFSFYAPASLVLNVSGTQLL